MWKLKILFVCLLPVLLCGAETAEWRITPFIGLVRFSVASNDDVDIYNAGRIRFLMAASIETSKKFNVANLEEFDAFMSYHDIQLPKLYRPEEMEKIPYELLQFLLTGFVSVEGKNYRVRIHLLDLARQEFLFSEEALINGATDAALWDDVMALTRRFLETAENLNIFDEDEPEYLYEVGDTGPAGGIIFYAHPSRTDGWRYLEAAPPQTEFRAPWGVRFPDGIVAPSYLDTKSGLGTGRDNTEDIIEHLYIDKSLPAVAAQLCSGLYYGGYNDWFLPSEDELMLMYTNRAASGLGGFRGEPYWSSTESSYQFACFQSFREGRRFFNGYKTMPMYVRAIRAF
jgi:hypothetical protein